MHETTNGFRTEGAPLLGDRDGHPPGSNFVAFCQGMEGLELLAKWVFGIKPLKRYSLLAGEQKATEDPLSHEINVEVDVAREGFFVPL